MCKIAVCVVAALLACGVAAAPAIKDELMTELGDDTATVESTVREARAAPSHIGDLLKPGVKDAYIYVYGNSGDDEGDLHGYSKKMDDKGQDGYKHYDSYHKKDGDKYGYEKHSEYGQGNKAKAEAEDDSGEKEEKESDDDGEETRAHHVTEELHKDDKKKKNVESYGFDDEGAGYYGSSEADGDAEEEGDGGSYEYEEAEESEEAEDDY
ncbi:uncharacterized protein LOC132702246 [Cylas formicarius]|uniref:uncharacterized protein LOC132702246 n=1 Tax=Cylas formicarius TaxID=197179 RepID=UPI0029587781|nr:uncharacterized protein LOC132702246 [Cylas formicarius]